MGYECYDPMCSCATCDWERNNKVEKISVYKVIVIWSSAVLYISSYFAGSLALVLGTTMALGAVILSTTQLRSK
jgi:hypothetical protein